MPSFSRRWSPAASALQAARQAGAQRDLVAPGRLQVVHAVERRHLVHRDRRHAEDLGDVVHGLGREPAFFVLRDDERAIITADCFWSGGYFATSRSIFCRESVVSMVDISGPRRPNTISRVPMMATAPAAWLFGVLVHRRQAAARRAQLHAVGLVGAVGDEVHPELALRVLDRGVGLAPGTCMPSVNSLKWWISSSMLSFISPRVGGAILWLSTITGPGFSRSHFTHCRMMRFDCASPRCGEIAVVGVAVHADRHVELHAVVDLVGLLLAQVPFDARRAASRR